MDTVTESGMAIAIAREGGLGIIHKNMSIERQAYEVEAVKRTESGILTNPVTLSPEHKVGDALKIMREKKVSGFPICEGKKLVGIFTNRDLRFHNNPNTKLGTAMVPQERLITGPEGITLEKAREILYKHRIEKLPIINKKRELVGLVTIRDILNKIEHPFACVDNAGSLRVGAAVGTAADTLERVDALVCAGADVIVVDTAHGHSLKVLGIITKIKKKYALLNVIGGNIVTARALQALVDAGADGVKVGIGAGSICTTRIVAGVGVPQLSAILDCCETAEKCGVPIIADGGVRYSGDCAKAIAAGADAIMIGSLFAGTAESPGETILFEGRTYKSYRGMGSLGAMRKGSGDRYFQETAEESKMVPEGIEGRVPFKGPVADSVNMLVGGLKVAMGYCGAKDIKAMKKAEFIRITNAGIRESHPHDVTITKEAPNYRIEH